MKYALNLINAAPNLIVLYRGYVRQWPLLAKFMIQQSAAIGHVLRRSENEIEDNVRIDVNSTCARL